MRARLLTLALFAPLVVAEPALGLAGGATGGGGGGFSGGGGYSGGSSSSWSSSGGSGGGADMPGWAVILVLAVTFLPFLIPLLVGSWRRSVNGMAKRRLHRRAKRAEAAAHAAHADDGYWHPEELKARVKEGFFPIQRSWEKRDVSASRPYVSDALYERHRLQLEGLEKQHRINRIQNLKLHEVRIVRIYNITDDEEDRFVAYVHCSARDWVEDSRTGRKVNGSKQVSQFEQYWSYVRHPEYRWVLDEIQQKTEGDYHLAVELVNEDEGPSVHASPAASGS